MNGVGSVGGLPGVSGGDVRWIEIAKHWQRLGHNINVFTPNSGKELCKRLGLDAVFYINDVPNDYSIKTYFLKYVKARIIPDSLKHFKGVTVRTSETKPYDPKPLGNLVALCSETSAALGRTISQNANGLNASEE